MFTLGCRHGRHQPGAALQPFLAVRFPGPRGHENLNPEPMSRDKLWLGIFRVTHFIQDRTGRCPPWPTAFRESQARGRLSFVSPARQVRGLPVSPPSPEPWAPSLPATPQPSPRPPLSALAFSLFIFSPWKFPCLFCRLGEASERRFVLFCAIFLDVCRWKSFQIGNGSPFCYSFSSGRSRQDPYPRTPVTGTSVARPQPLAFTPGRRGEQGTPALHPREAYI